MQFWLAAILDPSFGQKIDAMVGLAPIMYLGHIQSEVVSLIDRTDFLDFYERFFFTFLFFVRHNSEVVQAGIRLVDWVPRTVWVVVEAIVGFDRHSHMDPAQMPMMARNDVGGTGTANLDHYLQLVDSGKFQTPSRLGPP